MSKLSIILMIATVVVTVEVDSIVPPPLCWDPCTLKDLENPRLLCVRDRATNT
ncbi:GM10060 [Drosophila sechellia]|uniref:GM10060 n=1 Tax=Drosophila sechellia TaxID=7238 RepID=B4IKN9_DROSE|nr:GM10060 [Drosophila sechellia]